MGHRKGATFVNLQRRRTLAHLGAHAGHDYIGRNYIGHHYIGHNYVVHGKLGHSDIAVHLAHLGLEGALLQLQQAVFFSFGLYRYGLHSYGLHSYGLLRMLFCSSSRLF